MAEEHTIHRVVEQHIQKHTPWDALPSSVRQLGQTREQYHKAVVQYALKHQWRWRDSLVQKVLPDEREYYEELLKMSSKHLMVRTSGENWPAARGSLHPLVLAFSRACLLLRWDHPFAALCSFSL